MPTTTSGSSEPHAPPHVNTTATSEPQAHTHGASTSDVDDSVTDTDTKRYVQFTGRMTAYLRAAESCRLDRIIHDPFAKELAGDDVTGQVLALETKWGSQQHSSRAVDLLAIRTRYLDDALRAKRPTIQQVVILAAGMDARAYRLDDALRNCHVFELDDSSELLQHKQQVYASMHAAPVASKVDYIVADLANDAWEQQLRTHGLEPLQPTFWCIEGLLYYLDRSSIVKVLKTIDALSAPGSELWADMCGAAAIGTMPGLRFGDDHPVDGILSLLHWDLQVVAALGTSGTHFGRDWTPLTIPAASDDDDDEESESDGSERVVPWYIVAGTKPAHQDVAPLL